MTCSSTFWTSSLKISLILCCEAQTWLTKHRIHFNHGLPQTLAYFHTPRRARWSRAGWQLWVIPGLIRQQGDEQDLIPPVVTSAWGRVQGAPLYGWDGYIFICRGSCECVILSSLYNKRYFKFKSTEPMWSCSYFLLDFFFSFFSFFLGLIHYCT